MHSLSLCQSLQVGFLPPNGTFFPSTSWWQQSVCALHSAPSVMKAILPEVKGVPNCAARTGMSVAMARRRS